MKMYWTKAAWVLAMSPLLLAGCKKNDTGVLDGPLPQPTFTYTSKQDGLTTVVTFTNTTQYSGPGTVQYEWDFGDGTTINSASPTVSHTYTRGGTLQVQLLASARGGNGFSPKQNLALPDLTTLVKQLLTGGTSKTWVLDNSATGAISVGPNDGDVSSYYTSAGPNTLPACQTDDEYTFSSANVFTYDAKAQTLVADNVGCSTPRSGNNSFTFGPATGAGLAQIDMAALNSNSFRPFIGVTNASDLTYRIISIDAKNMVLRAGKSTSSLLFQFKMVAK